MFSLHHSMPTDSTSCKLYCMGHGTGIWSAERHWEADPTTLQIKTAQLQPIYSQMAVIQFKLQSTAVHSQWQQ